jgi:hypothetical protein
MSAPLMTAPLSVFDQQERYLVAVAAWAKKVRATLGPVLDAHGERVARDFELLFREHCEDVAQGRPTAEKDLQAFLIREAHRHGGRLEPLNAAAREAGLANELVFVSDELALPVEGGRIVCDLLALRQDERWGQVPVVIELKTERQLTRLVEQVEGYARLVDVHAASFANLFAELLGAPVSFGAPCEKWIVWPGLAGGREPRAAELAAKGARCVGYEVEGEGFSFRLAATP